MNDSLTCITPTHLQNDIKNLNKCVSKAYKTSKKSFLKLKLDAMRIHGTV